MHAARARVPVSSFHRYGRCSVPQASLLTGAARNATVRSKTVATLHCLGKKEFTALLREHPEVFDNVERMIQASPRLRRAEKYDQSMQSVAHVKTRRTTWA